ncbi:heparan-alpha-glucosaminide N-acetyltransferase [Mesorhizobium denitrificans]|uniref:DUF1624 domain-containing protein n=1 Tax=Mesorhizobium denitrificans TaxID=2294114 RepID=A0A371X9K2_9HYPH|nr:heparan-alpha-glucosaminide N-acetyltransferase [Mesorhizobium denitrificans]RFC65909.1 DUF1624 domain-containing protein [Mesorhizobium denitrificans]
MDRLQRIPTIDIIRGIAIGGVVLFHVVWDLEFAGLIDGVARHPAWLVFGRSLAGTFMVLVGVSLVLAHRGEIRWGSFSRRLGTILLAAAAITVVTRLAFPANFVYFGILHAIAVATLIGALFLGASALICLAVGTLVLILPLVLESSTFDMRWLAWIGFAAQPPPSNDFVPVFPWVGLTLLGMAAMKWTSAWPVKTRLVQQAHPSRFARTFAWMGRRSLPIYLVHQPILLAIILPLSWWLLG